MLETDVPECMCVVGMLLLGCVSRLVRKVYTQSTGSKVISIPTKSCVEKKGTQSIKHYAKRPMNAREAPLTKGNPALHAVSSTNHQ